MRRLSGTPHLLKNTHSGKLPKFPKSRALRYPCHLSILGIIDAVCCLCMFDSPQLSVIQTKRCDKLRRQPISPEGNREFPAALRKVGFGQVVGEAFADHQEGAGAVFFDVTGQEERLAKPRVPGNGPVRVAKAFRGQRRGQNTRIPYFDAINKDGDLHRARRCIVTMGNGIDDGLADHIRQNFIADGRLGALGTGTDTAIKNLSVNSVLPMITNQIHGTLFYLRTSSKLGHDEVRGHIHLLEDVALEDAVERHRPLNFRTMEMHAPHLSAG
jgi:hypothetical protein